MVDSRSAGLPGPRGRDLGSAYAETVGTKREAEMEMNRNHFLLIGLVVLFLGIQFRRVEKYVLNEPTSRFIAERTGAGGTPAVPEGNPLFSQQNASLSQGNAALPQPPIPAARRTFAPPKWLGWVCVSVGGVLVLQSLAMRKPGG